MIALTVGINQTKLYGMENKLLLHLGQMLDGSWIENRGPPPTKKLLVEQDVLEYLCHVGQSQTATHLEAAVSNLILDEFYYLLRVEEYTTKGK